MSDNLYTISEIKYYPSIARVQKLTISDFSTKILKQNDHVRKLQVANCMHASITLGLDDKFIL